MSNHSNESASYPCQKCSGKKTIYLTFDDGPEPGTLDIYNKLNELRVPATFFFVGENVIASETGVLNISHNQTIAPGFFKTVFDNPLFQIGNHSQTQSRQFYLSYYDTGLRIDPTTLAPSADLSQPEGRRSVLVDFELASVAFTHALNGTPNQYIADRSKILDYGYRGDDVSGLFSGYGVEYFRFLTARMPGTNSWRLPNKRKTTWDSGADRDDEADGLYNNGYHIIGWDYSWDMRADEGSDMSDAVNAENKRGGGDGFWDDYYTEEEKEKDRLIQSIDSIFSNLRSGVEGYWDDGKCILLMHDRQFRSHPDGSNPYVEKLEQLIKKCQDSGYKFDVLENY